MVDVRYVEFATNRFETQYALPIPHVTKDIKKHFHRRNVFATKANYVSCIKDYIGFCLEHGLDPAGDAMTWQTVIYWFWDRAQRMPKGTNSICTWGAAASFWAGCFLKDPDYFQHPMYKKLKKILIDAYDQDRETRLPIPVRWLHAFNLSRGILPSTWHTCDLDLLMESLVLDLIFFTLSRPGEVVYCSKRNDEFLMVHASGLTWKDIQLLNDTNNPHLGCLRITIRHFKNQENRRVPKVLVVQAPMCGNKQHFCQTLDFVTKFKIYKQRRRRMQTTLLSAATPDAAANLTVSADTMVFVRQSGARLTPAAISELVKTMARAVAGTDRHYSGYSLRIGATSVCNQQRIDLVKVCRYVAWSVKALPHVIERYISFTAAELAMIPFEMCHGRNIPGKRCVDRSGGTLKVVNLWSKLEMNQRFLNSHPTSQ